MIRGIEPTIYGNPYANPDIEEGFVEIEELGLFFIIHLQVKSLYSTVLEFKDRYFICVFLYDIHTTI